MEGPPGTCSTNMPGWTTCSGSPDIQPGCFCITTTPQQGNSFMSIHLGESIGQKMPQALVAGETYTFTLWLANDPDFASAMTGLGCPDNLNGGPGLLNIFLGNASCGQDQLIWNSGQVNPGPWTQYTVTFTPNANYQFFTFFSDGNYSGSGNILIDNMSPQVSLAGPQADFTFTEVCAGEATQFTDTSTPTPGAAITSWQWDFGDSNSSTLQSPSHTYASAGTYNVKLTVEDVNGNKDDITQTVLVHANPDISVGPDITICEGESSQLWVTGAGSYLWTPAAGLDNKTVAQPWASPSATTVYEVTVTDPVTGCFAREQVQVNVNPRPNAVINGDHEICEGESITLTASGGTTYKWLGGGYTKAVLSDMPKWDSTYAVVVFSDNNCTDTAWHSVLVKKGIRVTHSGDVAFCEGESATITASGAAFYDWTPATGLSSNQGSTVLAAPVSTTTYTITGTAGNGCTHDTTVTATVYPTVKSLDLTLEEEKCGQTNGEIHILSVTGGTGPYQYSLDNVTFITNPGFTGLQAGSYTVYVRTAYSCVYQQGVQLLSVDGPNDLDFNVSQSHCGKADGVVEITGISNGTPPYVFRFNGGSSTTEQRFPGLTSGSYSVQVEDANGCTYIESVSVSDVGGPDGFVFTKQDARCSGPNGEIHITGIQGGVAPYTYSLNGGAFSAGPVFSGLLPGSYGASVKDNTGCVFSQTILVGDNPGPQNMQFSVVTANCGQPTGQISVDGVDGGTEPFQYAIDGGSYQSSPAFTGLAGGTYTVSVQDALGCTYQETVGVSLSPGPSAMSVQSVPDPCSQGAGSLTVTSVSDGVAPYLYILNGSVSNGTGFFPDLMPGNYTITVEDDNGCQYTENHSVNGAPAVDGFQTQVVHSSCGQQNGTIIVTTVNGGTSPFQYQLNGGTYQSANKFSALAAGTYQVAVKDFNGCTHTDPVAVQNVSGPTDMILTVSDETCTAQNGSITVDQVGDGQGPMEYAINGGVFSVSPSFAGLAAGEHIITVRDAAFCTLSKTANLDNHPGPTAFQANPVASTCGDANGALVISDIVGGTAPYKYILNGSGGIRSIPRFDSLIAGNYGIDVQDANGCVAQQNVTINDIAGPYNAQLDIAQSRCGEPNGSIRVLNVDGGTPPYSYTTDGIDYGADALIAGLPAGNYNLYIKDANGCIYTMPAVVSDIAGPTGYDYTVTRSTCGDPNGAITLGNVAGGTAPYMFQLNGDGFKPQSEYKQLLPGVYQVDVRDANDCIYTEDVVVDNIAGPHTLNLDIEEEHCERGDGRIVIQQTEGGTEPYRYAFQFGAFSDQVLFDSLRTGIYSITVSDGNDCRYNQSVEVPHIDFPLADFGVSKTKGDAPLHIDFYNQSSGAELYDWWFSDGTRTSEPSPFHTFSDTGMYQVRLIARNQFGCPDTASMQIRVLFPIDVYIPTGFTPGDDGLNDVFRIEMRGVEEYELRIFNRWGELLHEQYNGKPTWDGKYRNETVPPGVYTFILKLRDIYNQKWVETGKITVVR